jgi:hypothetical protein
MFVRYAPKPGPFGDVERLRQPTTPEFSIPHWKAYECASRHIFGQRVRALREAYLRIFHANTDHIGRRHPSEQTVEKW